MSNFACRADAHPIRRAGLTSRGTGCDRKPRSIGGKIVQLEFSCDPRDQVDIIHGGWSSALDPMCYDTETDRRNSRVIIDACIPFRRKKTFPVIARSSKALDDRIREKWAKDLPKGF